MRFLLLVAFACLMTCLCPAQDRVQTVDSIYRQERRRAAPGREEAVEVDLVGVSGGMGAGR